ncbi:MAG: hypothetical protein EZS28_022717 [Streblomastix strix]|uniref:Flavodoxin-like domain-containing protein n=1 Tax=Streblomastix strix TaxID=222440 RepID=A0A5J4VHD9_9EUKA|nr:MAG: hypothetical protein EZS28_022717 [Streblomastix strix]
MTRALIVYITQSGNTKKVADLVQAEFVKNNVTPVVEIIKCDVKPGLFSALKQGYRTQLDKKYTLDPPENDASQFDYVVFGAPVWMWKICPPLDEWLKASKFDPTKTNYGAFIQCQKNGFEKSYEEIEKITGKELSSKTTIFDKELKQDPQAVQNKVEQLVRDVISTKTTPPTEDALEGQETQIAPEQKSE